MARITMIVMATLATAMVASVSAAFPCKDPLTGRLIKCPPRSSTGPTKATSCKDAKGRFVRCGTPGAKRIP
jgi:hypothetical protein